MDSGGPLHILFVEDAPEDVILAERELRRDGFEFVSHTVETEETFLEALRDFDPDLIISDYGMPHFNGMRALELLLAHDSTIPFIILTGSLNEETAVECMKSGATEYVIKDRIARLPFAVKEALTQKAALRVQKKTENALRESEMRYKSLFENTSAVMLLIDPENGQLVDANPAAELYYGWSRAELQSKRMLEINMLADEEILVAMESARRNERNCFHFKHLLASGEIRDVETYSGPIKQGGQTLLYSIVHDITMRRQAEEALAQRVKEIDVLYHASQRLSRTLDPDEIYDIVLEVIRGMMDCDRLLISDYDADAQNITAVYLYAEGERRQISVLPSIPLAPAGEGTHSFVIRTGEPIYFPQYRKSLEGQSIRYIRSDGVLLDELPPNERHPESAVLVPLKHHDIVTGVILVQSFRPDAYTPDQIQVLEALTGQVSTSLSNARLYQQSQEEIAQRKQAQLAEREQRILAETLSETAKVLTSTLDQDTVMDRILDRVGDIVPHDVANILLIENGIAWVARQRGYSSPEAADWISNKHFLINQNLRFKEMAETKLPLVISDTALDPYWETGGNDLKRRSYAGAPMVLRNGVIGFLNVASTQVNFYTEDHGRRLHALAAQAAIAIDNARLYETTRSYAQEMEERVIQRTAELHQAKEHVEAILNSSSDIIILTDNDGIIRQTNTPFEYVVGVEVMDVVGKSLSSFAAGSGADDLLQVLQRVKETGQSDRVEFTVQYGRQKLFEADAALSPIICQDGGVDGIVCSLRDISVRKELEAKLHQTIQRERELNDLKSRFISMASHEFRTPLAIIQTSSDLLRRYGDRLSEEDKAVDFGRIQMSIRNMTDLLNDVLTISRGETGEISFKPEQIDFTALCQEILDDYRQMDKGRRKIILTHNGQRTHIWADPKHLKQAIGNLVSNSIKYSPPDSLVNVTVTRGENSVEFRIEDHGIGIPDADKPRLFEAFHRAENVENAPGTGLGLAIALQAIELHQGTIDFESTEGEGTTFTVTLPVRRVGETGILT